MENIYIYYDSESTKIKILFVRDFILVSLEYIYFIFFIIIFLTYITEKIHTKKQNKNMIVFGITIFILTCSKSHYVQFLKHLLACITLWQIILQKYGRKLASISSVFQSFKE